MVTVPIIPIGAPQASIEPHSAPPISPASPCRWPWVATWMAVKIPATSSHAEEFIRARLAVGTEAYLFTERPEHRENDSVLPMFNTPVFGPSRRNRRRLNHAENQRSPIVAIVAHPGHLLPIGLRGHSQANNPAGILPPSLLPSNQARPPGGDCRPTPDSEADSSSLEPSGSSQRLTK